MTCAGMQRSCETCRYRDPYDGRDCPEGERKYYFCVRLRRDIYSIRDIGCNLHMRRLQYNTKGKYWVARMEAEHQKIKESRRKHEGVDSARSSE